MCYAKPGPRCSAHTKKAMVKAQNTVDLDPSASNLAVLKTATDEWLRTPEGIRELRRRGERRLAKKFEEARIGAICASKRAYLNTKTKYAVAKDENADPKLLAMLAKDFDLNVRYYTASNPSTPPRVLAQLVDSQDSVVRWMAASNPSTPPTVLARIVRSADSLTRTYAASNVSMPNSVLARLANDQDVEIRQAVARNRSTPPKSLTKLVTDENLLTRHVATRNPSTPTEALESFARNEDEDAESRELVLAEIKIRRLPHIVTPRYRQVSPRLGVVRSTI